jgi:hypothetical protein
MAQDANTPFDSNTPFAVQGGLGDHVAARVLNMNGYNITNLADPFFEGDAVTLGYLNRNAGWDHQVTQDVDFGGFKMLNIGDVILDGSKVYGGSFEAPAISHPEITGGTLSGISMRNAAIEVPRVTGGTFEAPALLNPSIDKATITNGEMTGTALVDGALTGGTATGTTFDEVSISSATVTGDITFDGGRLTGIADPQEEGDVMTLSATQALIEDLSAEIQEKFDGLVVTAAEQSEGDDTSAVSVSVDPVHAALSQMEDVLDGLDSLSGDLRIDGVITGSHAQYRPTPSGDEALGVLAGSDILSALSEVDAIVYKLPGGALAAGIDPETIPAEMAFVLKAADGGDFDSIDYTQLIGPMIATIQNMDARIKALETQVEALQ